MKMIVGMMLVSLLVCACAGCANGTGGQIVGGILTGIGAGLSGL